MRQSSEAKARNRERILDAAAALIKEQGFASTGVDALMAASGQTAGAFYSHFRSKGDFLGALIEHELARSVPRFHLDSAEAVKDCFAAYLSEAHVRQPARGCVLPALTVEVARADRETRQRFERRLLEAHEGVSAATGSEALAWSLLAQAVGGVMLARAVQSPQARRAILSGLRDRLDEAVDRLDAAAPDTH